MSKIEIIAGISLVVISLVFIVIAIYSKNFKSLIKWVGTLITGVLSLFLGVKTKKANKLKEENSKATFVAEQSSEKMNSVATISKDFGEKENEAGKHIEEKADSPSDRINRLNNL